MKDAYTTLTQTIQFLDTAMSEFERTVEIENAEQNLLEKLGNFTQSPKVQLTRIRGKRFLPECVWEKSGNAGFLMNEERYTVTEEDAWFSLLAKGEILSIDDVRATVSDRRKESLEQFFPSLNSLYVFPVLHESTLIALVVFCNPDRKQIHALQDTGSLMTDWLANRLIKNDNRVQKIMSGLGRDYTAAFMINLDTDNFEVIINQKANNAAKEKKQVYWTDYLNTYADKYCVRDSGPSMKRELSTETLKRRFTEETEFHFTFETVPNEKAQTTFQAHAVKEYGEDGNYAVIGFRCVDEILKKERQYQKKLDEAYQLARKQLDIITSAIPGGIKISYDDAAYSFKYVSEQYASMLGYGSVQELMDASGGTIAGIAHPEDLESGIAEALKQYQTSNHYAITYRMRCKDGSYKYIEDHGHKVINPDGSIEHWNLILDKNELVEKTIALESEKKANAAKTQFLSRMSHDIRTPLNGIIGLLEIDRKHPDNLEMVNENREKMQVAANHLLSLINDILELNKLSDGEVVLYSEVFDVRKVIQKVVTITTMKAQEEGILLYSKIHPSPLNHPYVIGSALHIQQIFINIITNAIKYNRPGGEVCVDLFEGKESENTVPFTVTVRDTGIGMSEEFLQSIYEPFTQAHYDARSVYQGTGLGMPIVKNLIDRMGGTISIESKVQVGTTVRVTLPLQIGQAETERESAEERKDCRGIHVLLAEDNELNREIASFLLKDEGMTVTEAVNGQQAVTLFEQSDEGTFDLILMDILMPVMDGLQATKAIRASSKKEAKTIPVFAMTANAFMEDRKRCREAGMNEHLSKPLNSSELIRKILKYCR